MIHLTIMNNDVAVFDGDVQKAVCQNNTAGSIEFQKDCENMVLEVHDYITYELSTGQSGQVNLTKGIAHFSANYLSIIVEIP